LVKIDLKQLIDEYFNAQKSFKLISDNSPNYSILFVFSKSNIPIITIIIMLWIIQFPLNLNLFTQITGISLPNLSFFLFLLFFQAYFKENLSKKIFSTPSTNNSYFTNNIIFKFNWNRSFLCCNNIMRRIRISNHHKYVGLKERKKEIAGVLFVFCIFSFCLLWKLKIFNQWNSDKMLTKASLCSFGESRNGTIAVCAFFGGLYLKRLIPNPFFN